jgi:hypothetical protein
MKINPLSKVTLSVKSDTKQSGKTADSSPELVTFIYGIGLSGLTDFECSLTKHEDENEINLFLNPFRRETFFEHLTPLFEPLLQNRNEVSLHFKLVSTEPAGSTEIVKAIASIQQCGCGCDCGCH